MSGFPGRIFDGEGAPMDGRTAALTQPEIDACEHRSMVSTASNGVAPVGWIWLLNDDADYQQIPVGIVSGAVTLAEMEQGVLILCRRPEVGAQIRDGLLSALELAAAPDDAAGHA